MRHRRGGEPVQCDTAQRLDTLAAVHAANGNFEQAVHWQSKAIAMEALAEFEERLALYRSGTSYVEPTP